MFFSNLAFLNVFLADLPQTFYLAINRRFDGGKDLNTLFKVDQ